MLVITPVIGARATPLRMPVRRLRSMGRSYLGACAPGDWIDPVTGELCPPAGSPFTTPETPLPLTYQPPGLSTQTPTVSTPQTGSTTAAGAPAGSVLNYSGQWTLGALSSLATGATFQKALQQIASLLQSSGITITGSSLPGFVGNLEVDVPQSVSLTVQITGAGFASPNDVASVINHAVYQVLGTLPTSFSISLAAPGTMAVGTPAATGLAAIDWTTVIVVGIAGIAGLFALKAIAS